MDIVPTTVSPDANARLARPFLERLEDRRLLATNITQYHVDSQSTGANLTETQLTPSNVNAADFGQLYNTPLDGQVYAEPLVMTNVDHYRRPEHDRHARHLQFGRFCRHGKRLAVRHQRRQRRNPLAAHVPGYHQPQ